ncbi:RNA polymerase sigma factor SigJ [Patulibacter defluvii]|uniref:RNA polymerase sigma factor SigJ n=1 Tax=Patulibacter defluvii TaxID=3095358 RepID=UPI002A751614|nr:RNA polymerase sigma factor SigJ [Patulibacter sp. DM4]
MPDPDPQRLDALRRHAFAVAYRMLGSVADADDVAQEALLRLTRQPAAPDNPVAWLTTVATRLAIDQLRAAQVRRERYVGPWLPDPILEDPGPGPAASAELADSLSQALLVALERLTPVERAAFLLREAFDYDYAAIAGVVDRSEEHARQLVSRARKHLAATRPRFDPDEAARERLLERFLAAADDGDLAGLEALLADDAVLWSDGGGRAVAARKPILGAAKVARFMVGTARKRHELGIFDQQLVRVNGQPGRLLRDPAGAVWDVLAIDVVDGRIAGVRIVRNPQKLAHL